MTRKLNLAVLSTCIICEHSFHPACGRETTQRVCSHRCASVLGTRTLQSLRAQHAHEPRADKRSRTSHQGKAASAAQGVRSMRKATSALHKLTDTAGMAPDKATAPSAD